MKTIVVISMLALLASCNSESGAKVKSSEEKLVDSLEMDVNKGHNTGMAKMGKLTRYQQAASQLRDSIGTLPAAAQLKMMAYGKQLDTLKHQLDSAEMVMNKWMDEYRFDSLKDNPELRAAYLNTEKIKVEGMVGLILDAIHKGDSLLKIVRPGIN
ncbi:MAG: hypothetical protein EOO05_01080 [Chitinophagaceae bacterium]|nr:MAG: hypothetical protein EOO05_01080 [Chitinophagaceae bacterium]